MPLLSIDLQEPVAAPPPKKLWGAPIVFTSTNLTRGSVPGRGLLYSFLVHELALFSLIIHYSYRIFTVPLSPLPEEFRMVDLSEPSPVVYLPRVGGGSEGPRRAARRTPGPASRPKAAQARALPATPGLTYPGLQPIVSDVPNPTNTFQTILQPELKHPPLIKSFVPLPNIVQMAQAAPPPPLPVQPKPPEPRVVVPVIHLEPEKLPEAPNLKLPKTAPKNLPLMPTAKAPDPRIVAPAAHLEAAKLPEAPNLKLPKTAPLKNLAVMPSAKAPEAKPVVPKLPPIENLKSKIENPLEAPKLEVPTAPVHTLSASLMPSAKPPDPRIVAPVARLEAEKTPEAPKLRLPANGPATLAGMPAARPPEPKAPEAHPSESRPLDSRLRGNDQGREDGVPGGAPGGTPGGTGLSALGTAEGKDARNLLALSPLPAPAEESAKVPVGEARGRFAISPEPSQAGAKAQPGSISEGKSTSALGTGQAPDTSGTPANSQAGSGNSPSAPARAGGEGAAGAGSSPTSLGSGGAGSNGDASGLGRGAPASGSGRGSGTAAGRGTGTGAGTGATGTGAGTGATGTGAGAGTGSGTGSGSGAGTGNGGGAFPGISIQGGSLRGGAAGKPMAHPAAPAPPRGSYSLTIVSTSSSGGGLADFGVFRNERVYTVYLDMRQTVEDPAPSWTLQYAPLPGADPAAGASGSPLTIQQGASPNGGGQGLVPPFPLAKEQPHLPLELVQKYQHRLVVVYAIINKEGKFEQLVVKQSPNAQLNGPLLEALGKWVFRPAEVNGETVPVKALLGIPVALPQ